MGQFDHQQQIKMDYRSRLRFAVRFRITFSRVQGMCFIAKKKIVSKNPNQIYLMNDLRVLNRFSYIYGMMITDLDQMS